MKPGSPVGVRKIGAGCALIMALLATAGRAAPLATNNIRLGVDVDAVVRTTRGGPARTVSLGAASAGSMFDLRLAGLPPGVAIDAFQVSGGLVLFSIDVGVKLGSLAFADEDIVAWNGLSNTLALYWDGSLKGVPAAADVDAVTFEGATTNLLLSFDTTTALPGGLIAADEDVVRFAAGTFTKAWDGVTQLGIPESADLDALYHDGTNLYFSLDRTVTIGTNTATHSDVWVYHTVTHGLSVLRNIGIEPRGDLANLDGSTDRDGDGLTDFEELTGRDEPSTTWPGTATGIDPGGYTSNPDLADTDSDGFNDAAEALAGTDPRSGSDYLRFTATAPVDGPEWSVSWVSAPGRRYALEQATMLAAGFTNVAVTNYPAATGTNRTTWVTNAASGSRFFRLHLTP